MKKVVLVILLVSTILLLSTCAKRKEGYCRLKYQAVDTSESTIYYACQDQLKLSERPAQLKDLPEKISNRVNYFLAKIAGREIPLIIDRGNKSKLYLDTDGDGCLSDEKGFTSKTVKKSLFGSVDHYRFGPVPVKFEQSAEKFAQRIYVFTRDSYMRRLVLSPAGYHKGKVLLDNNIYEVAVVDGNFDAKYGKIFSPTVENIFRPGCDSFAIDLNHNGKLDFDYYYHSELMPLSRMVKVGTSYYSINVDESGESLKLNKIQPDFGTLDFDNANVKLKLWSDAAQQYIFNFKNNVQIPAGRYQALFLEWSLIDSEKNTYNFTSYFNTGTLRNFEISKNQTASFKIGPPFQIKTTAQQNRNTVSIGCTLLGQAGEQYRPNFKINGIQVSPAVLRIIDETGNVVYSGRFKYG